MRVAVYAIRVLVAASLLSAGAANAGTVVPHCEAIGSTDVSTVNVEFSPKGQFASWAVARTFTQGSGAWEMDYWVTPVDANGKFSPSNGKSFLTTTNVPWGVFGYFGNDSTTTRMFTSDTQKRIIQVDIDETTKAVTSKVLTGPLDRMPEYIYASRLNSGKQNYIVYLKALKVGNAKFFEIFWMNIAQPTVERQLTIRGRPARFLQDFFSNPRWIPNRRAFVFPFYDVDTKAIQVGIYNVGWDSAEILTRDPGDKVDPFPFQAPEYPGEWLMLAVIADTKIGVYRRLGSGPDMSLIKIVDIPSSFKYEQSAETFVWNNKTFISTAVNESPPKSRLSLGKSRRTELWLADIIPSSAFTRQVNTWEVRYALDPETLVTPTGVWFYGYQRAPNSDFHQLYKCRTGLGN